jgi:hypothetical protein
MRCLDGPAEGVTLMARRAPMFLRLVYDELARKWDALDALDDTPSPSETVHVYRRGPGSWSSMFACRGSHGGRYEMGDYRYVPYAPHEELRDTEAWREWVNSQAAADGLVDPEREVEGEAPEAAETG